jgi:hypothetical protein
MTLICVGAYIQLVRVLSLFRQPLLVIADLLLIVCHPMSSLTYHWKQNVNVYALS